MTHSELPHGEAWLLEIAVRYELAIHTLTSPNLREWLNRGSHELSRPELFRTLRRMFDLGDIEAFQRNVTSDAINSFFSPSDSELEAALSRSDKGLTYRLTIQGASRWEALANPNWTRYYQDWGWTGTHVQIIAASRERLDELIENSETIWGVVMPKSGIVIEVFRPWRIAPHWKQLPEGFRAEVPYKESWSLDDVLNPPTATEREEHRREYSRLRHWADSICGNCHV